MPNDAIQPGPDVQQKEPAPKQIERSPRKWQERLLPVMIGLLVSLTIFFFVATFVQMNYLHQSILLVPAIDLSPFPSDALLASAETFDDRLAARRLEILTRMEAYLVERRYHQASVLLMSSLWVRYLGFITGMILALVGASFVLGKLREPISKIEGTWSGANLALRSASPGIILAALGVILMFATILDRDVHEVKDVPIYLFGQLALPTPPEEPKTLLSPETFETPVPFATIPPTPATP